MYGGHILVIKKALGSLKKLFWAICALYKIAKLATFNMHAQMTCPMFLCVLAMLLGEAAAYHPVQPFLSAPFQTYLLHRRKLIEKWFVSAHAMSLTSRSLFYNIESRKGPDSVLIIGCGKAGKAIALQLRTQFKDTHIMATTTKKKRVQSLKQVVDEVIVIPQLAPYAGDSELEHAISKSDAVILADVISIFSSHSYLRTAMRVRKIVDSMKRSWRGDIIMLSSENAYGSVLNGDILYETSLIYPNFKPEPHNSNMYWHINSEALASVIRTAESTILNGPQRSVVFRTAGIWDAARIRDAAFYTRNRVFPACIRKSHMTFTTTTCIGKAVVWALCRSNVKGIYNLADINSKKITRESFYSNIHTLHAAQGKKGRVLWDPSLPLHPDTLYSMDPDPFLPTSQRSDSCLCCDKIRRAGFQP